MSTIFKAIAVATVVAVAQGSNLRSDGDGTILSNGVPSVIPDLPKQSMKILWCEAQGCTAKGTNGDEMFWTQPMYMLDHSHYIPRPTNDNTVMQLVLEKTLQQCREIKCTISVQASLKKAAAKKAEVEKAAAEEEAAKTAAAKDHADMVDAQAAAAEEAKNKNAAETAAMEEDVASAGISEE